MFTISFFSALTLIVHYVLIDEHTCNNPAVFSTLPWTIGIVLFYHVIFTPVTKHADYAISGNVSISLSPIVLRI